jgi:hypothetical protein
MSEKYNVPERSSSEGEIDFGVVQQTVELDEIDGHEDRRID